MWDPQVARFSAERRVIAPDLRGYGASPVTPGTVPFSRHADDLAELLDFLGVDTCVLAGLSMGGQLAMECWDRFGDRIRGLVLADTFATPETPEGSGTGGRWRTGCSPRACGGTPTRCWNGWSRRTPTPG